MEVRRLINGKIIMAVKKSRLTHAQVARAARTSRTRLTAILNRNTANVSTDLMLRILATLGYETKVTFKRAPRAA
jgi:transcriptional regulator with XRE-family HTH domain